MNNSNGGFMPKKMKVTRFSVSLPPTLVEELDKAWRSMEYESRSKAIHDAIRSLITEFEWMHEDVGQITGAVLVLHYLDKPGLLDEITGIQHRFKDVISSTMHIHLKENKCLEIIAVKGSTKEVRTLTQELMAKKGVKQVKVAAIAP
jgi:CopG family nickel-responsive transcriptional regulator